MMLALLGWMGLISALLGAFLLVIRGWAGAKGEASRVNLGGPARLVLWGSVTAMAAMQIALLTDEFSLSYVASHHASTTPFPFDVATAWAALEGSILLWGLVLAGFTWLVFSRYRKRPDQLGAAALAVMGAVAVFFFGLMVTVANPFEVCVQAVENGCVSSSAWPFSAIQAPAEGPGPNPLLQNHILMAVHPPMLYIGYVGLTVPFAYAIGALAIASPGPEWLRRSHRSTLIAWSFLTLGIVLGGWWAYEVLSWGGYWAWDPVENASLMPWLIATAFIHSALVQRRRGMLQAWNFVLVIGAFALTILGTFLTRSGTINSVHSFTQSAIGPALLAFLVLVLVGSFTLFAARAHIVASAPRIESFVSREGTFLINNLLLTVYAFVVLIGTTYPLILEAFTGTQVGVGEPFFNRLAVPLSFALLFMMGIGPVTPWRKSTVGEVWRKVRGPLAIGMLISLAVGLLVTSNGWVILAVALGTFVIAVVVEVFLHQVGRRRTATAESLPASSRIVLSGDQSFWAGQVSHIGVVLMAIGIAFAANLGDHLQVEMVPGQTIEFADHEITYESPFVQTSSNKTTRGARLTVTKDGDFVGTLEPAANFFGADTTGVSTPDVMNGPRGDLYVTLLDLDTESAELAFDTSPLIWLLWVGGIVTAAGGFWSMSARRRERDKALDRQRADV